MADGVARINGGRDGLTGHHARTRTNGVSIHFELASNSPVLSGRVIAEDRRPVSESTVFLVPHGGDEVRIAQTDQSGAYSFASGIEPGDYKLVAVPDLPESQRRDGKLAARFLSRAADVKLRPQETKVADITLRDAP